MPVLETYEGTYLWHYVPSLPAAIIFAILFGIITTLHGWKMMKNKTWICLPFVIGGILEEIGYIARATASNSTGALLPYIMQAIFLVLPPVFFAASLYMVYSRIVRAVNGEAFSPISPRWTTRLFVLGDLITLNIQSSGSGLLTNPDLVLIGDYIIVAGLGLQVIMFAAFVYCCAVFNRRFRAHLVETGTETLGSWRTCFSMLYATSLAILVRNIYRMVEFVMGDAGYLTRNEWPTYIFDASLMLFVMIGFYIWYPIDLGPGGDAAMELSSHAGAPDEHELLGK